MIAITTNNSISVKPRLRFRTICNPNIEVSFETMKWTTIGLRTNKKEFVHTSLKLASASDGVGLRKDRLILPD